MGTCIIMSTIYTCIIMSTIYTCITMSTIYTCITMSTIYSLDGKCHYKGKSYQHGQKWTDGCDYECVCEDGQTGRYKCYNR
jgi:hypothetical protein